MLTSWAVPELTEPPPREIERMEKEKHPLCFTFPIAFFEMSIFLY